MVACPLACCSCQRKAMTTPFVAAVMVHVSNRLNASGNSRCLVAEAEASLIGFLNATGSPIRRLRHATTSALGVRRSH